MMRSAVVAVALAATAAAATPATAHAQGSWDGNGKRLLSVGLTTDQRLVGFDIHTPGDPWDLGRISGLSGDRRLIGIDFRVQNGKLYGVGNAGGIYTITSRAQAVKVSRLTVPLSGTNFGVDFNPAANRLRVISDTGQNLRHNIDDPSARFTTIADGALTNPTTPPTRARGVTGAAYTNNDLNAATATTLFDIDTVHDRVVVQSPANAGNLAPTGNLGFNAGPSAGFDIYYKKETGDNKGFAALSTSGRYRFYSVNVLNGDTDSLGAFPAGRQVFDIALPLDQN
ncbi:DUF4394 domain-containing protein [Streptomyces koelreuteriae]|uniref:DUF4394 domain-containing protein n=1 Tax=Streptomyces koelreuteriae TaxID=2838015 RepID=UPI003EBA0725